MSDAGKKYTYNTKEPGYIVGTIILVLFSLIAFFGLILTTGIPGVGIPIIFMGGVGIFLGFLLRSGARVYPGKKFINTGISGDEKAVHGEAERPIQKETSRLSGVIDGLGTGEVKISEVPIDLRGLLLAAGEKVLVAVPNVNLIEFVRVEKLWNAKDGLTVRHREGVISKGTMKEGWEEQVLDNGRLLITTQRLVYDGMRSTVETYWPEIISIEPGKNGVGVKSRKKEVVQYFVMVEPGKYALNMEENGQAFSETLSGELLAALIVNAMRQGNAAP